MKVLLIEDESDLAEIIKQIMEKRGFEVEAISTSLEAVAFLTGNDVDVVISDYRMAGMNGVEIYEYINGTMHKNIPFIIFTGMDPDKVILKSVNGTEIFLVHKGCDSISNLINTAGKFAAKAADS